MAEIDISSSDMRSVFSDVVAAAFSYAVCRSVLLFLKKNYDKGLFDVYLLGKLSHISAGLIVMLCWPLFSSSGFGRVLAGLIPGFWMIGPLVAGFGKGKVDKRVKFLKKYQDSRVLFKAALGYVLTIALATVFHWRRPIGIAAICNLCAGDGVADIAGRRFGSWKLPYNKNKSLAGSIGMAVSGFLASILFMYYFSWFGYIQESPNMVLGFLMVSVASALVESHPLSSKIEDNLTVPLSSILVGTFVL